MSRDPTQVEPTFIRGLTWDHPRGYQALSVGGQRAATADFSIAWDKQPLEGFESHPIDALAARFDLIVMDHPHIGEAVKARCLRPLDEIFERTFLSDLQRDAIGATFASLCLLRSTLGTPTRCGNPGVGGATRSHRWTAASNMDGG